VDKLVAEYGGPRTAESVDLIEALRQCDELYRQLTAQLDEQGLYAELAEVMLLNWGLWAPPFGKFLKQIVIPGQILFLLKLAEYAGATWVQLCCR